MKLYNGNLKKFFNIYVVFTVIFPVMAALAFLSFFLYGRLLIWAADGWTQHLKALVYYAKWLRTVLKTLFVEHSLDIPTYTFGLGYGADILTTLNYYCIGDPLNVFCCLIPEKYMAYYYNFLIVFRMYLSGIAFILFCRYIKLKGNVSVLAGAFTYVFSGYTFYSLIHPFFINPMIYLPLVLLGVERLKRENKSLTLILSVFLAAASNFYFLYMIAAFTVIYVLCINIEEIRNRRLKRAVRFTLKTALCSCLGVLLSFFLLLPVLIAFGADRRIETSSWVGVFYSADYYKELLQSAVSYVEPKMFNTLGYSVIVLEVILLFFIKKGHEKYKIAYACAVIGLLTPFVGYALNGFSYTTSRYIWGFNFLTAVVAAASWNDLFQVTKKQLEYIVMGIAVYLCAMVYAGISLNYNIISAFVFGIAAILLIWFGKKAGKESLKIIQPMVLLILLLSILLNADYCYSKRGLSTALRYINYEKAYNFFYENEAELIRQVSEDEFIRYTGSSITDNAQLNSGVSSTQYFWSLSNGVITEYLSELGNLDNYSTFKYYDLDDRTILNTLASMKYYSVLQSNEMPLLPYGYKKIPENSEHYDLFENQYVLPFGYTYSCVLYRDRFEALNMAEKEDAMLQTAVLENGTATKLTLSAPVDEFSSEIKYSMEMSENVEYREGEFLCKTTPAQITLNFEKISGKEVCLLLDNIEYLAPDNNSEAEKAQIDVIGQNGSYDVKKTLVLCTERYKYNTGRKNFAVNLGSCSDMKRITITFGSTGTYRLDSIRIIERSFEKYAEYVEARRENVLENVDFHNKNEAFATNHITGMISLGERKLLVLSVPYSSDWTAYVDGEEKELVRANIMFSAIETDAGEHEIELIYHTPGQGFGLYISIAALIVILIVLYCERKNCN